MEKTSIFLAKAAAHIAWNHALSRFAPGQLLTYQNAATSFTIMGVLLAKDSAAVKLGADVTLDDNASLSLGYDGSLSARSDSHGIRGGLKWAF